jgi:hypothetical protein
MSKCVQTFDWYCMFNPLFLFTQNCPNTSIHLYGLPSDESRDTCGGRRANCSAATDVFVRRPLFGMSPGLTPSTTDAEGPNRWMQWIET